MNRRLYLAYSELAIIAFGLNLAHLGASIILLFTSYASNGYFVFSLLSQLILAVYVIDAARVEQIQKKSHVARVRNYRRPGRG